MKNFRFGVVALGSALAIAGVLIACSSDDTIVTSDAGPFPDPDGGTETPDGGGEQDADPDVLIDAGLTFDSFRDKLAVAFCRSVARCCFGSADLAGDASVDGGFYDEATCLTFAREGGFEGSLTFSEDAGAPLILNQAQALSCMEKLEAISCTLKRDEFVAVRAACFNSVRGTAAIGASCSTGIDCVPGAFCNRATSKCEELRAADASCGDFTNKVGVADEACSWRGSGDTNRYCESFDFGSNQTIPQDQWRCRDGRSNGHPCVSSLWCSEGLCDDRNDLDSNGENDYICRSPITYFPRTPDYCDSLVKH